MGRFFISVALAAGLSWAASACGGPQYDDSGFRLHECTTPDGRVVMLRHDQTCRPRLRREDEPLCVTPDGRVAYASTPTCAMAGFRDAPPGSVPTPIEPPIGSSGGSVYVRGYYRANGTYVAPHTRRR